MRHAIFEHPVTHLFAVIRLPHRFVEGDTLPIPADARWFKTRDDAVATLSELFNEDEGACPAPPAADADVDPSAREHRASRLRRGGS